MLPKKFMFNQSNKLEMNKYSLGNDDDKSDCDDFLLFLQTGQGAMFSVWIIVGVKCFTKDCTIFAW